MDSTHRFRALQFWIVWLMLLFVGIVAWALRPKNKGQFDEASRIPFRDEGQENDGHADQSRKGRCRRRRYHRARVGRHSGTEQPTAEVVAVRSMSASLSPWCWWVLYPGSWPWQDLHRRPAGLQPARSEVERTSLPPARRRRIARQDRRPRSNRSRPIPSCCSSPSPAARSGFADQLRRLPRPGRRRPGLPDPGRRRLALGRQGDRIHTPSAARRPLAGRWRHPDNSEMPTFGADGLLTTARSTK